MRSSRVRCGPNASAIVDSLRIAFKRNETSSDLSSSIRILSVIGKISATSDMHALKAASEGIGARTHAIGYRSDISAYIDCNTDVFRIVDNARGSDVTSRFKF